VIRWNTISPSSISNGIHDRYMNNSIAVENPSTSLFSF
jgi:hypothetical protein